MHVSLSRSIYLVLSALALLFITLSITFHLDRTYAQVSSLTVAQDSYVDPNNPAVSYNGHRLE